MCLPSSIFNIVSKSTYIEFREGFEAKTVIIHLITSIFGVLCVMPLDQFLLTGFTGLVEVKKPSLCRKVFCVLYFGTSDTHKFLEYFGRIWFDGSFFGV